MSQVSPAEPAAIAREGLAFEEFFEAERRRLFRALYLMSGSRQEAEELTQDAFLKVWERWDRVREMDRPTGYLHRVGMNAWRSRSRRLVRAARNVVTPNESEDAYSAADLRDELVRAIRDLTPRQRAGLVLTELLDQPSEEAALQLGVTPSTVRNLVAQARGALKEAMSDE